MARYVSAVVPGQEPGPMVKVRSGPETVVQCVASPPAVMPTLLVQQQQVVYTVQGAPQGAVQPAAGIQAVKLVGPAVVADRQPRTALASRPNWDIASLEKPEQREGRDTRGVRKSTVVPRHHSSDFVARHYHTVRELGKGAFGTVHLVSDREKGNQRVCKTVSLVGVEPKIVEEMRKEISLLATLDHPHVVKLFEWAEDSRKQEIVLILEYLPGGDGLGLLRNSMRPGSAVLHESLVARLTQQVLVALQYCHLQGVLHRDIKPENFMLTAAAPGELPDCKVIDFGLAVRREQQLREICGTPTYIAPEIIQGTAEFTPKADVWSVGVSTLELLSGVKPFGEPEEFGGDMHVVFRMIAGFRRLEDLHPRLAPSPCWNLRSAEARDFCRFLLQPPLQARPEAAQALSHPFLQRHKAAAGALTGEMLQSLASYADAHPLAWCCLFIIAARQGTPDLEKFGKAFVAIDADGDGKISRDDLARAVSGAAYWWDSSVAVDDVVKVADLDHTGGLSFTQFVAACLYARHAKSGSLSDLMRLSFEALDTNRDGQVSVSAIRTLFRERDAPFLNTLPQNRSFGVSEWVACLENARLPRGSGLPNLDNVLEDFGTHYRANSMDQPKD